MKAHSKVVFGIMMERIDSDVSPRILREIFSIHVLTAAAIRGGRELAGGQLVLEPNPPIRKNLGDELTLLDGQVLDIERDLDLAGRYPGDGGIPITECNCEFLSHRDFKFAVSLSMSSK